MAKKGCRYCPILPAGGEGRSGDVRSSCGGTSGVRRGSSDRFPIFRGLPTPLPFTFRDPKLQERYRVGLNRIAAQDVPIEIKVVNPPTPSQLKKMEPKQMFWVRARGYIGKQTPWPERKLSSGV